MSAELRDRIAADVLEVAKDPSIEAKLTATAQVVRPGGPAEFAREIEEQRTRVAAAAKAAGFKQLSP